LQAVIEGAQARRVRGEGDPEITQVTRDSRAVRPGALFVAVRGGRQDGHDFAAAAVAAGAVAVLGERAVDVPGAVVLTAADSRRALAACAAAFTGHPSRRVRLAGVTGTNGKTTVTYLVDSMMRAAGVNTGVIGTVGVRFAGAERRLDFTTPEAPELCALVDEMAGAGVQACVMEVSSHALAQHRADGLRFRAAAFTNLTRDHLDFHGDMESYFLAKRRLFTDLLDPDGAAVVNVDDPHGARLGNTLPERRLLSFSARGVEAASLRADGATFSLAGTRARLRTPEGDAEMETRLVGAHNLENLLAAAGLAFGLGAPLAAVLAGAREAKAPPGRLERVEDPRGRHVFVDYAHTDDALACILVALRGLGAPRIACVFGCGGDRDPGKRPLMGRAVGAAADLAVVTSDNPRTEDPLAIIGAIVPGVEEGGLRPLAYDEAIRGERGYVVEPDRRAAIVLALASARKGDVVLIAGKGHEDYQIVGATKHPFDDRVVAREAVGS
jgi:UDP-N-acetylmuramoyl-L-alanyl-D-glutamate--2,6-diaminopimelate ligase